MLTFTQYFLKTLLDNTEMNSLYTGSTLLCKPEIQAFCHDFPLTFKDLPARCCILAQYKHTKLAMLVCDD